MKAVILCGGLGSRLSEYTKNCPKPLLKVNQLSIIEWQIISLKKVGVTEILINLHYLAEKVMEYLRDGKHLGVKIKYIFQEKLNGTGGGVKIFQNELINEEFFFVVYGDILTNENLFRLVNFHIKNKADCSIYVHERQDSNSLFFINEDDGMVLDFIERPSCVEKKIFVKKHKIDKYFSNSAIYLMSPKVLNYIPKNIFVDIPKQILIKIINDHKLYALPIEKQRYAIDSVEKYQEARINFKG